jgi:phenylacetate-coenzyme A ligase PaaK-like adenylate-forming protein
VKKLYLHIILQGLNTMAQIQDTSLNITVSTRRILAEALCKKRQVIVDDISIDDICNAAEELAAKQRELVETYELNSEQLAVVNDIASNLMVSSNQSRYPTYENT